MDVASVIGAFQRPCCLLAYCSQGVHHGLATCGAAYSWGRPNRWHRPRLQSAFRLHPQATRGFQGRSLRWQLCRESQMHLRAGGQRECGPHHAAVGGRSGGQHPCRTNRVSWSLTAGVPRAAACQAQPRAQVFFRPCSGHGCISRS